MTGNRCPHHQAVALTLKATDTEYRLMIVGKLHSVTQKVERQINHIYFVKAKVFKNL